MKKAVLPCGEPSVVILIPPNFRRFWYCPESVWWILLEDLLRLGDERVGHNVDEQQLLFCCLLEQFQVLGMRRPFLCRGDAGGGVDLLAGLEPIQHLGFIGLRQVGEDRQDMPFP